MTRAAQNLLLILIGAALLWITVVTGEYVNYVKQWLRVPLIGSAVVLLALGAAGLRRDWHAAHDASDDCHGEHAHGGPRVAWLLCLPIVAIFAIAPPALGSFTAARSTAQAPPPQTVAAPLPAGTGPVPMTVGEFIGRSYEAQLGGDATLQNRQVRLTGFAAPRKGGGWFLTRLQMSCCAADAIAIQVTVRDIPAPEDDAWVEVTGTWIEPTAKTRGTGSHELRAVAVKPVRKPSSPYE